MKIMEFHERMLMMTVMMMMMKMEIIFSFLKKTISYLSWLVELVDTRINYMK